MCCLLAVVGNNTAEEDKEVRGSVCCVGMMFIVSFKASVCKKDPDKFFYFLLDLGLHSKKTKTKK